MARTYKATREQIESLYLLDGLPLRATAKILQIDTETLMRYMQTFGIRTRSLSESHIGQIPKSKGKHIQTNTGRTHFKEGQAPWNKNLTKKDDNRIKGQVGRNHWNWQNGKTKFIVSLRELFEYKQWRTAVFERDDYTCQKCGETNCRIDPHHKKAFAILIQEFLKIYDQFSPIEDKETLLRLAIKYKPFWEVDNGKTLCRCCHLSLKKQLTGYYQKKVINYE